MRGDDAAHDDAESDALLAVWRAWSRNHELSQRDLFDAAYRGAVDGLRKYTGHRRKYRLEFVPLDGSGVQRKLAAPAFDDGPTVLELLALHPPKTTRDWDVIASYIGGEAMVSIGARYGVSAVRVSQIMKAWTDGLGLLKVVA